MKQYTVGCRVMNDDGVGFVHVEAANALTARSKGKAKFIKELGKDEVDGREVYTEFIFEGHVNCIYNETGWGLSDKDLKKL